MITDAILTIFVAPFALMLSLVPGDLIPEFMSAESLEGYSSTVRGWIEPFSYWVPIDLAFRVAVVVLAIQAATRAFYIALFLRKVLLP